MITLFAEQITEHQSLADQYRRLAEESESLAQSLLAIEQEASSGVSAIASTVKKISDSKAIAILKSAVLSIFPGDGGGNQPTDPTPETGPTNPAGEDDDDEEFDVIALNGETGECLTTDNLDEDKEPFEEDDADSVPCASCGEDLEANYPEYAAAAIAGICRDCEAELIEAEKEQQESQGDTGEESLIFHPDNAAIAWIPSEDGKLSVFIGFEEKSVATSWFYFLQTIEGIELGAAAVMEAYNYELRCFGLGMAQVSELAQEDFTKPYSLKQDSEPGITYHPQNKALMYLCHSNGKISAWIGFKKKAIAKSWQRFIEPMAEKTELMAGEAYKCQLFCKGLLLNQVNKLAQQDFSKPHSPEIGSAKPPESKKKFQPIVIELGTKVSRLLTPSEVFEATSLVSNGTFFAKSILNGDRVLLNIKDVALVAPPANEGAPKYAKVLLSDDEWFGHKLPIFSESEIGLTLRTPQGDNVWYKRDGLEICDPEIDELADPTEPQQEEPAPDTHSILEVGAFVQVISDRYPQFMGHTCTVIKIDADNLPPILVRGVKGEKPYYRRELKFINHAQPQTKRELVTAGTELDF